ncbi:uncharacterized protein LOC144635181 [Oculina patagonica]
MHASTEGSFINPTLKDDKATSVETRPKDQEKREMNAAQKEAGRANAVQGSNRALLVLVITMCLISLVVLLLTLLMLFGKIGDGCGCSTDEASSISDKSHTTNAAKIKALEATLEENNTSFELGLMERIEDLEKFKIKTEAGYNALQDDLNMTKNELLLITDNITLTSRLNYLDAVFTRLKSVLNRTNTDVAELKSAQTKTEAGYNALQDDLNMTKNELLLITDNITLTSRLNYLDAVFTRLKSVLNRTNTDVAELKSAQTKTEAGYNALQDDLNMTKNELLLITDNITLTSRLNYLDAVFTRLKSVLNRTNTDVAELKSAQTKTETGYNALQDDLNMTKNELSLITDNITLTSRLNYLDAVFTRLKSVLNRTNTDVAELKSAQTKTEAGYNALQDDLNMTTNELLLITDNITTLTSSRLNYLDAGLTRLKSALNRTNTDVAELKSAQTKEKVIYHQSMTPSWLEAHASDINSFRLSTTEQLTFIEGPTEDHVALLKVPVIPANVLHNSTQLTVKIVVFNDVDIGTKQDSDIRYGLSDGKSFVGFKTADKSNYFNRVPCFGNEGISGTSFTDQRVISNLSPRPSDTFYPGQFVITLKLDAHESWGSCYTAHDGGFVKTADFNSRLVLSNGLTLEVYKHNKEERVGIKFIEVTVVEDI